jgi:membrane protein implicated in regulation of membrane protease activity
MFRCSFTILLAIFGILMPAFPVLTVVAQEASVADTTEVAADGVDWSVYVPQIVIFVLIFLLAMLLTHFYNKSRESRARSLKTKRHLKERIRESAVRNAEEAGEEQSRED